MSIHKLTAGSGYDYLTRQVAALDATEKGHLGLASYYTERGETPGVWMGSGMAGIDGLNPGDVVTAEQMRALFGAGLHPLAEQRQQQLQGPDLTVRDYQAVTRLGAPFKIYQPDVSPFRVEVAKRIAAFNQAAGLPGDWAVPAADRARIRTEVAREFFVAEHGRQPEDARELAATIAKHSRPRTQAVAGYDLTFSPVKSVSALWAVADQSTAAADRTGPPRRRRGTRCGSSNNTPCTPGPAPTGSGRSRCGAWWRPRSPTGTAAPATPTCTPMSRSPTRCRPSTGAGCPSTDGSCSRPPWRRRRPTTPPWRTTSGPASASGSPNGPTRTHGCGRSEKSSASTQRLNARWSTRRAAIETRRGELAADFQRVHGRPPTPVESLKLAQQATLETRDAKHEPRTLTEQRAAWLIQAGEVLGGPQAVQHHGAHRTAPRPSRRDTGERPVGQGCGRPGPGGDGGTPFHLADLACPRRGPAAGASRRTPSRAE